MKNPLSTLTYSDFRKIYSSEKRFSVTNNHNHTILCYTVIDNVVPENCVTYFVTVIDNLYYFDAILIADHLNKDDELYLKQIFEYCKYNHRVAEQRS